MKFFAVLLGISLAFSASGATWPASTNKNNTFFGTNIFTQPTTFSNAVTTTSFVTNKGSTYFGPTGSSYVDNTGAAYFASYVTLMGGTWSFNNAQFQASNGKMPLVVAEGLLLSNDRYLGFGAGANVYAGDMTLAKIRLGSIAGTIRVSTNLVVDSTITATNGVISIGAATMQTTNAAPTGVTWGVTVPDLWFAITNGTTRYMVPGWVNH